MTKTLTLLALAFALALAVSRAPAASPPQVGDLAPNFSLHGLDDRAIELKTLTEVSPVVLVVLRGWPGYQCPLCTKQVREFVAKADTFKARGIQVLMVYPGPAAELKAHADAFLHDKDWPAEFLFVTDPDYTFTNAYNLRWEAKNETAYPSTFVIQRGGRILLAHISKSHGNRISPEQAMAALP